MPAVFVHGNPETAAIWGALFDQLERDDLIALSPPGFGAPAPGGWTATRAEYIAWLAEELAGIDGPIDLVGHDWGGGHALGFLIENPDSVQSWCVDLLGILHPDYVWHDAAQGWQTEGVGEEMVAGMVAGPVADRAAASESLGMPPDVAIDVAGGLDEETARCVLALYRSATQPALAQLGQRLTTTEQRPGLVFMATEDHYAGTAQEAAEVAASVGASVVTLEGQGHWWMFAAADQAADALLTHWENA
jgi:pimeloyl-ACP methyl ester carboxylesterase